MQCVTAQGKMQCVTAQDKMQCVTAQDKMQCVTVQDKTQCVTAQDKTHSRVVDNWNLLFASNSRVSFEPLKRLADSKNGDFGEF